MIANFLWPFIFSYFQVCEEYTNSNFMINFHLQNDVTIDVENLGGSRAKVKEIAKVLRI